MKHWLPKEKNAGGEKQPDFAWVNSLIHAMANGFVLVGLFLTEEEMTWPLFWSLAKQVHFMLAVQVAPKKAPMNQIVPGTADLARLIWAKLGALVEFFAVNLQSSALSNSRLHKFSMMIFLRKEWKYQVGKCKTAIFEWMVWDHLDPPLWLPTLEWPVYEVEIWVIYTIYSRSASHCLKKPKPSQPKLPNPNPIPSPSI